MKSSKVIVAKITPKYIFYPKKAKRVASDNFAIFIADIDEPIENCDNLKKIKLKGNVCELELKSSYQVTCLPDEGDTYLIASIGRWLGTETEEDKHGFLCSVLKNETIVKRMYYKLDDPFKAIEDGDYESLCKVRGIAAVRARKLTEEFLRAKAAREYGPSYLKLFQMGFSEKEIQKIHQSYDSLEEAVTKIDENPYSLSEIGFTFQKIDSIADTPQDDPRRIEGFFAWYLRAQAMTGKSYLTVPEIEAGTKKFLGKSLTPEISNVLFSMVKKKLLAFGRNPDRFALWSYYQLENDIADELLRIEGGLAPGEKPKGKFPHAFKDLNVEEAIAEAEEEEGFTFVEEQREAVYLSKDHNVILITGLAGTGKSSAAKGIVKLLKNYKMAACALAGKAAVRITEATGLVAGTIHRTLNYQEGHFSYDHENPLEIDALLIDEATMINGSLFLSLLKAVPTGAKLIIMGDINQLTPIGSCQVFSDLLACGTFATVRLTKPHRQALDSGIIPVSLNIAFQKPIFPRGKTGRWKVGTTKKDMEFIIYDHGGEDISNAILQSFSEQMRENIMDIQICVPLKAKGELSCFMLNNRIQEMLFKDCPNDSPVIETKMGYLIREGDKVLNTENNYSVTDTTGKKSPIFNGSMGIVQKIQDNGYSIVSFEDGKEMKDIYLSLAEMKNLELAYACTVHKLQGSGFHTVIVGLDDSSYHMNTAELLYTAVTRAKKQCTLIGNGASILNACNRKEVQRKQTFLKSILVSKMKQLESAA